MAASQKDLAAIALAREVSHVPWCEPYELMISGMPYATIMQHLMARCWFSLGDRYKSWTSSELIEARSRASKLCGLYNDQTNEQSDNDREGNGVLGILLAQSDKTTNIERPFSVLYGCNTRVGRNFFGNVNLALDDSGFITIGDNVIIAPDVHFITTNHATEVQERLQGVMYTQPITVGGACWIGARATLLPGAQIGYGCTIGAGAVVHGFIPDYSVAVGVPARVVRRCFPRHDTDV